MRLEGRIWKERTAKLWMIEVPLLDVMTQGTSRKDAYRMVADAIEALVNRSGFRVDVRPSGPGLLTVGATDQRLLIALLLKRQREAHQLTLVQVARRLRSRSPNAYARYEQGRSVPSLQKLNELMKAIDPAMEPVLKVA